MDYEIKSLYPGVWKITLGLPEEGVPTRFAYKAPLEEALNSMPECRLPEIASQLDFRVTKRGCRVIAPMKPDEKIYGLGISTRLFNKTDKRVFVRPTDHPETEEGGSHGPAPFFVSTAGYGVFIDTARYAALYFGTSNPLYTTDSIAAQGDSFASSTDDLYRHEAADQKTMLWEIPVAKGVDIYIFAGSTITETVSRCNLLAGGGCVPPLWGLGIHYRGDAEFSAEEHVQLAQSFRDDNIPCDMWGLEPRWQTQVYSCSFVWNKVLYPDPDDFGKKMAGLGMHISAWQHCFTHPTSPIYADIYKYAGDFKVWKGAVPDFTLKKARDIFAARQTEILYSKEGFDSVKLDECDHQPEGIPAWSFPECSEFPSGLDGEQMHSLFGYLYQIAMIEPLDRSNRRTWGLCRNTHALAAPLPYSIYSDSYTQDCFLRGLVNTGFSGQLWVPELREAESIEDLYRRIQICLLSSMMLVNCWYLKLPPWKQIKIDANRRYELMPDHEEVTNCIRDLFNLRMSLIPYIYSAFCEYAGKGIAPIRALVMDYPHDPETYDLDTQFMLGDRMMVCPALTGKATREVYFPKGTDWVDYYTGERIKGGTRKAITTPIEQLAVYVMDNTVLPVAKPLSNVARESVFEITVNCYGTGEKPFVMYEDDGETLDYLRGGQNIITVTNKACESSGGYKGKPRYSFTGRENK